MNHFWEVRMKKKREMWRLMLLETMERKKYVEDLGLFSVAKAE